MSQTPSFRGLFKSNTERVKNWKTSWSSLGLWRDTIVKAKTGVRKHWLVTEISVWETKKTSDWSKTVGDSKPCGRSWCCLVFWHALGCSETDFWHVLTDRISWSWTFPGPGGNHHHATHEAPSTKLHYHFHPGMGKWKDGYYSITGGIQLARAWVPSGISTLEQWVCIQTKTTCVKIFSDTVYKEHLRHRRQGPAVWPGLQLCHTVWEPCHPKDVCSQQIMILVLHSWAGTLGQRDAGRHRDTLGQAQGHPGAGTPQGTAVVGDALGNRAGGKAASSKTSSQMGFGSFVRQHTVSTSKKQ